MSFTVAEALSRRMSYMIEEINEMIKKAKWITSPRDALQAAFSYRKDFRIMGQINKATLYVSAMGIYVPHLNGNRVGTSVLAPGWTSYNSRVQYQTYDITDMREKENLLDISVGQGWAVGHIGFYCQDHFYADRTSIIAAVVLEYADGRIENILSDESFEVYTTEVVYSELYYGETVDKTAPVELVGNAVAADVKTELVPQINEPVREMVRLAASKLIITPKGERVIDFGQNLAGYAEIRIKAPRGSRIVIHHAEVLDKDGNFYNENYRNARSENVYVCSGGDDVFKPSYCFQGFRYIKLCEYPFEEIDLDAFVGVAIYTDMKRTGSFLCGNEKINQLYHNILWSQRGNYIDIPTDCPQRDERLGWTADAHIFFRAGAFNYDIERFFVKWLGDVSLEQREDGSIIGYVPNAVKRENARVSAGWGDASCIIPWDMYCIYGNVELLRECFPMMKKWVGYMRSAGKEYLWLEGTHYGDWLAMDSGADSYLGATSTDLIATAYYAYSTSLVIKAGEILGEDVSEYRELYANVRRAFREYFMENGMPKQDIPFTAPQPKVHGSFDVCGHGMTQTGITLILHFDLCEDDEREALAAKLAQMIRDNGMKMSTGFIGTPYLLGVLSEYGYTDIAYELLFQEKNPSWLYAVCHGATTTWEHWNGIKEDGSFWGADVNSFNHYAYGAVLDWIVRVVCGIKPVCDVPAYSEVEIAPHPDRRLGFAQAEYMTKSGLIKVRWYYKGDSVFYEIDIPDTIKATVKLPSGQEKVLDGGSYCFAE